jgi:hypothetical protein
MRQLRFQFATALLAFLFVTPFSASLAVERDDPDAVKIKRIKMSAEELRAAGIAVKASDKMALPNSCAKAGNPSLSLSNEIVAHFRSRGFSLASLCLGLSSIVNFDMETGRQLPLAIGGGFQGPLNLPDCFRDGAPLHDCTQRYHFFEGVPKDDAEQAQSRDWARRLDAEYRRFIKANRPTGVFYKFYETNSGKFFNGVNVARLFEASGSGIGWVIASGELRRGYGYTLNCCEGPDTAAEDVNLQTYRKTRGAWKTWKDQR